MPPNPARHLPGQRQGTRRAATLRQPPAVTARRIVASLLAHEAATGERRAPEHYTHRPETLAVVRALLGQKEG